MAQLSRSALQVQFASGTFATEEKFVALASSFFNFTDDTFSLLETPDTVEITNVQFANGSALQAAAGSASFWRFNTGDKANRQEYYVWYSTSAAGLATDPGGSGIGIQVIGASATSTSNFLASHTASAINVLAGSHVVASHSSPSASITLTTLHTGSVADAADGNVSMGVGFVLTTTQGGAEGGTKIWDTVASGHLIPVTGLTQDIGSSALPIRSLFMSGSSLHIGASLIISVSAGVALMEANQRFEIRAAGVGADLRLSAPDTISISCITGDAQVNSIQGEVILITNSNLFSWRISGSGGVPGDGSWRPGTNAAQDIGLSAANIRTVHTRGLLSNSNLDIAASGDISLAASGLLALNGSTITLDSSTDVTIAASNDITLTAGTDLNLVGPNRINLTASSLFHGSLLFIVSSGITRFRASNVTKLQLTGSQIQFTAAGGAVTYEFNVDGNLMPVGSGNRDIGAAGVGLNAIFVSSVTAASQNLDLAGSNITIAASNTLALTATGAVSICSLLGQVSILGSVINIVATDSGGTITLQGNPFRITDPLGAGPTTISTPGLTINASSALALNGSAVTINGTKAQVIGTNYSASVAPGAVGHERTVELPDGTDFVTAAAPAQYWEISTSSTGFYVWYAAGVSTDPVPVGRTGIQVTASTIDNSALVASNTQVAIDAVAAFNASVSGTNSSHVIITNVSTTLPGSVAVNVTASVTFSGVITGSAGAAFGTGFEFAATAAGKTYLQVYNNGIKQMEGATKNWTQTNASTITFTASGVPLIGDDIEFYGFGV